MKLNLWKLDIYANLCVKFWVW